MVGCGVFTICKVKLKIYILNTTSFPKKNLDHDLIYVVEVSFYDFKLTVWFKGIYIYIYIYTRGTKTQSNNS